MESQQMSTGGTTFYPNRSKGKQFTVNKVLNSQLAPYIPSTLPGDVYISSEKRENLDRSVKLSQTISAKPFIGADPGIVKTTNKGLTENVFSVAGYMSTGQGQANDASARSGASDPSKYQNTRAMTFGKPNTRGAGEAGRTISGQDFPYVGENYDAAERRRQELTLPNPLRSGIRPPAGEVRPFLSTDVQPRLFDPEIHQPAGGKDRSGTVGFQRSAKAILASVTPPWKAGYVAAPSDRNKAFGDRPVAPYYSDTYNVKVPHVHKSSKVFVPVSTVKEPPKPCRSVTHRYPGADVL